MRRTAAGPLTELVLNRGARLDAVTGNSFALSSHAFGISPGYS